MKLLLDTHVLLWAAGGLPRLPAKAKDLIEDEKGVRHLAALGRSLGAQASRLHAGETPAFPAVTSNALPPNVAYPDDNNSLIFSVASIWEIVVKRTLR